MGLLPDALPGYQAPSATGLPYAEMLNSPQVKALYVMGANPARHLSAVQKEFLVVQDIMLTKTAQQAEVVLPAVTFAEKDGSMTNIDHHVQAIRRALLPLPGTKADWEILLELAHRLGQPWSYNDPRDVLREIAASNPFYAGLTWADKGDAPRRERMLEFVPVAVRLTTFEKGETWSVLVEHAIVVHCKEYTMSFDIIKGMATTLKNMGRKPTTVSFPEQEREPPPRLRGRHVLHRYENGLERCVACYLCAAACPADVIYIEAEENTVEHRVSPSERYAQVFDMNLLRCIFCGYCQAACPTRAITLEHEYKLACFSPEEMIYHKEQLLEPLGQATIGTNADWYEPPPANATQPVPQENHVFDGFEASAASVGMGDLPTQQPVLLVNEEQDEDRRKLAGEQDGQHV